MGCELQSKLFKPLLIMRTKISITNDKHMQINGDCGLSSHPFAVFWQQA